MLSLLAALSLAVLVAACSGTSADSGSTDPGDWGLGDYPAGFAVTGHTIEVGGHCWFGSDNCGTGVAVVGNLAVGANSNFMKNAEQVWTFLSQKSR